MKHLSLQLASVVILLLALVALVNLVWDRTDLTPKESVITWYNDRGELVWSYEGRVSKIPVILPNGPKVTKYEEEQGKTHVPPHRNLLESWLIPSS